MDYTLYFYKYQYFFKYFFTEKTQICAINIEEPETISGLQPFYNYQDHFIFLK